VTTFLPVNLDARAVKVVSIAKAGGNSPIKALRLFRGLTTRGLASAAYMDPAQLDLIEQQSELGAPLLTELESLARALDVSVDAVR
jgi:hypothetical protein